MEVLPRGLLAALLHAFLRNALDYLHRKGGDDWCRAKPSVPSGRNHKAPTLLLKRHSFARELPKTPLPERLVPPAHLERVIGASFPEDTETNSASSSRSYRLRGGPIAVEPAPDSVRGCFARAERPHDPARGKRIDCKRGVARREPPARTRRAGRAGD